MQDADRAVGVADVAVSSARIPVQTWLHDHAGEDSIATLVRTWLRRRRQDLFDNVPTNASAAQKPFWPAEFFGLDGVHAYQKASPALQQKILWDCAYMVLGEAIQIERAGIAYAAKMSLIANTTTERQLYGVFVADEVAHLESLRPFAPARTLEDEGPFLELLSAVIENGSRTCLQYIVQVVLEGWGLTHYRHLRDVCSNDALRDVFDRILGDEAAHHGSGILLLNDGAALSEHKQEIQAWMRRFLALVQMGPVSVLEILDHHVGPMSVEQRRAALAETDGGTHTQTRLELLRELMGKPKGGADLVAAMESEGAFRPWDTAELL